MDQDTERLLKAVKELKELKEKIHLLTLELTDRMKAKSFEQADLADLGYLFRELEREQDDARKEAKARRELATRLMCIAYVNTPEGLASTEDVIKGELATATLDLKMMSILPKKGQPEYYILGEHFGMTPDLLETGLFKFDWVAVQDYVSRCMEDGLPIPPGLGKKYPDYRATFRKH